MTRTPTPTTQIGSAPQIQHATVAVLLATYNGARFIEPQIRSLQENATRFTLHWLDDHSTDDTREAVRAAALSAGIELKEWHQPQHLGAHGAFFQLLECVEADVYLFCDQDDIWQPGKIDATVADLLPDVGSPALCFSDPLMFKNEEPEILRRVSDVTGVKPPRALDDSRLFMSICAWGHTQGLTRPLREIFLRHKDIARTYSMGHDWWMYLLAVTCGTHRMLSNAPTTLYRRHGNNITESYLNPTGIGQIWALQQLFRKGVSRQAQGFIQASSTLPPGPKLERLVAIARLVATLDRRQSPAALIRLARRRAMWPNRRQALWFAAACLYSHAPEFPFKRFQLGTQATTQH
jgi:glycosyltransferase involved in cell wall biosynthesis